MSSMSIVSHIFICLFVTLYSLLCWVICLGLVFSSRTPYDIISVVIVAQDETRPQLFGLNFEAQQLFGFSHTGGRDGDCGGVSRVLVLPQRSKHDRKLVFEASS